MIPDTLKQGMVFEKNTREITILLINGDTATIKDSYMSQPYDFDLSSLHQGLIHANFTLKLKPLDKAMKELDKQFCTHKNIRRDMYFSAAVYLTCKDCGKPMN